MSRPDRSIVVCVPRAKASSSSRFSRPRPICQHPSETQPASTSNVTAAGHVRGANTRLPDRQSHLYFCRGITAANSMIKILVIVVLVAIVLSLFTGLGFLVRGNPKSRGMVNALTVRVALSVLPVHAAVRCMADRHDPRRITRALTRPSGPVAMRPVCRAQPAPGSRAASTASRRR